MISEFQHWIDESLESQNGKTILITGGNSGIGYYTALVLAKLGHTSLLLIATQTKQK